MVSVHIVDDKNYAKVRLSMNNNKATAIIRTDRYSADVFLQKFNEVKQTLSKHLEFDVDDVLVEMEANAVPFSNRLYNQIVAVVSEC